MRDTNFREQEVRVRRKKETSDEAGSQRHRSDTVSETIRAEGSAVTDEHK